MAEPEPLPVIAEQLARVLPRVSRKLAEQRGEGFGSGGTFVAGSSGRIGDRTAVLALRNVDVGVDQIERDYQELRRLFRDINEMARRHGVIG